MKTAYRETNGKHIWKHRSETQEKPSEKVQEKAYENAQENRIGKITPRLYTNCQCMGNPIIKTHKKKGKQQK